MVIRVIPIHLKLTSSRKEREIMEGEDDISEPNQVT